MTAGGLECHGVWVKREVVPWGRGMGSEMGKGRNLKCRKGKSELEQKAELLRTLVAILFFFPTHLTGIRTPLYCYITFLYNSKKMYTAQRNH